ncbi:ABC transporter substrate-binding protein [Halegenticoccus soli]|uniref:ABC transporter substrate-binding protein n=1 Tax=Halegenticoccus soli TaxID=1985678 RepID=UPI000C6D37DF|nr:ABC transporter substrate-binding protein [Halegenticoccus soli]
MRATRTSGDDDERLLSRRGHLKAITAAGAAGLAGCLGGGGDGSGGSGGDQQGGTIKFTHLGTFGGEAEAFIPEFEKRAGNVTVKHQQTPAQSASSHDYYVNQFISQSSDFDVGQMDVIWPAEFWQNGWIAAVKDPDGHTDKMLETPVEAATIDDTLVGMPLYTDANALYYRKDVLDKYDMEPPKTYTELVEQAQTIMEQEDKDWNGYIWQGGTNEGLTIMWLNWLWGMGGTVRHDGVLKVNTEKGVRALQHAVDLIHEHNVTPKSVPSSDTDGNRQTFQNGNTLFMRNWPYAISVMNEDGSPVKDKFDVAPLPTHEDHPDASNSCLGGWNVFVNEFSDNKGPARKFASFMASLDVQKRMAVEFSRLPVRKEVYEDEEAQEKFPQLALYKDILPRTKARPASPKYTTFSQVLYTNLNAALVQSKPPKRALDDAQKKIDSEVNSA